MELKYNYFIDKFIDITVLQEIDILQSLKDFFQNVFSRIKNIVDREAEKIKRVMLGDSGEFYISVPVTIDIQEAKLSTTKTSSSSKLKGTLFEIETVLELKRQVKGMKSDVSKSDSDRVQKQLKDSLGRKAGPIIKEVSRAAKVSAKLILNPISEQGGKITEVKSTGAEGMYSRGSDKFDILVRWKKVRIKKERLDRISLKLYSNKTVTLSNKAIHTFFEDWFSKKHANEVDKLIDKDKKIKELQSKEKELNKKVNQMRRKFKKSLKVEDINEQRREIRSKIHPRIMKIVFDYIQELLNKPTTRKKFIENFLKFTGLGNEDLRMVFVLNTKKGRMQGMVKPPEIDLSNMKLVYKKGSSTFQIKNGTNNKTMINFGIKIGGGKINVDVPFTTAKFKRF